VGCFSDIPQYVLSRLNLTAVRSCSKGNETESCQSSQSGTMSAHSTEILGKDSSMSSAGGFLAKTSAQPAKVLELKENEADSGKRWQGLLVRYDQDMFSSKIVLCSEQEDSALFSKTLPKWGMMQDGECLELDISEERILEKECGYLPTPNAGMYRNHNYNRALCMERSKKHQVDMCMLSIIHWGGRVKIEFLETMMAWPMSWTELKPLGMDKFQQWRQQHLKS